MNREIKFRAWDKNDGMFYDVQKGILFDDGSKYIFENFINPKTDDFHKWTLMQYTGLKDKNGRECYEGDKVTNSLTAHHGQVIFSDEYACFNVVDINGKWVCSMGAMHSDGFEITGNIYEDERK